MNERLGMRICKLRKAAHLTQKEMAKKLKISCQKYSRIENGINDISYELIVKIAKILEVSTNAITSAANEAVQNHEIKNANKQTYTANIVSEMIDFFYANKQLYKSIKT